MTKKRPDSKIIKINNCILIQSFAFMVNFLITKRKKKKTTVKIYYLLNNKRRSVVSS